MNNSKVIQLFSAIKKDELTSLTKFVHSPYFNRHKDVITLYNYLKKQYPEFKTHKLDYEYVCQHLFNHGNIQKLRYVMTDLSKLLERYLSINAFEQDQKQQQFYQLKSISERGIKKQFELSSNKVFTEYQNSTLKDSSYYSSLYKLNELSFQHTLTHQNRSIDSELQNMVDNLDISYLSEKLKYSCEIINRMNILNVAYNIDFLDYILDYLNQHDFSEIPSSPGSA